MKTTMKKIKIVIWIVFALLMCVAFATLSTQISKIFCANAAGADDLKDSTLVGPVNIYEAWNCYAFALGYEHEVLDVGAFCNDSYNKENDDVDATADKVKRDLEAMGCKNVVIANRCPNVGQGEELIAVRVEVASELSGNESGDYHFMRYFRGEWFHKPPYYGIMMYNYQLSNDRIWTDEGVYCGLYCQPAFYYDSEIRYIKYTPTYKARISGGEAVITGMNFADYNIGYMPGGDLFIPETVNGYPVTGIEGDIFSGSHKIFSVTLPKTLKHIGANVFKDCLRLSKVEIANDTDIIQIGDNAFKNTSADMKFTFPKICSVHISLRTAIFSETISMRP